MWESKALGVAALLLVGIVARAEAGVMVEVDAGSRHQTMDGFGATHNSLVYEGVGDTLGRNRSAVIGAVYGQVGINMGNLEIGTAESRGGWNGRANDNNDPNVLNPTGWDWSGMNNAKTKTVDLAKPLGFTGAYPSGKLSTRWRDNWMGNLLSSNYSSYLAEGAEQVFAVTRQWKATYGAEPQYYMLFNEALSGNGELPGASTQTVVDLVKAAGQRLRAEGFKNVKFVVPAEETEQKSLSVATAILSDPAARQYVGAIAYHPYPYGSDYAGNAQILATSGQGKPVAGKIAVRNQLRDLGAQYKVPVWMTEVSNGGSPTSFDSFRARAVHIHDELEYANASAYFGMNNMWDKKSQQMHFNNSDLFGSSSEGTIALLDNDSGAVTITGIGYAIGHYARWIDPGAQRLHVSSGDPLVQVSAFVDRESGRLVLVLINNASAARALDVQIANLGLDGASRLRFAGEQSTASGGYWRPMAAFSSTDADTVSITVPGLSVTTIAAPVPEAGAGAFLLLGSVVGMARRRL